MEASIKTRIKTRLNSKDQDHFQIKIQMRTFGGGSGFSTNSSLHIGQGNVARGGNIGSAIFWNIHSFIVAASLMCHPAHRDDRMLGDDDTLKVEVDYWINSIDLLNVDSWKACCALHDLCSHCRGNLLLLASTFYRLVKMKIDFNGLCWDLVEYPFLSITQRSSPYEHILKKLFWHILDTPLIFTDFLCLCENKRFSIVLKNNTSQHGFVQGCCETGWSSTVRWFN